VLLKPRLAKAVRISPSFSSSLISFSPLVVNSTLSGGFLETQVCIYNSVPYRDYSPVTPRNRPVPHDFRVGFFPDVFRLSPFPVVGRPLECSNVRVTYSFVRSSISFWTAPTDRDLPAIVPQSTLSPQIPRNIFYVRTWQVPVFFSPIFRSSPNSKGNPWCATLNDFFVSVRPFCLPHLTFAKLFFLPACGPPKRRRKLLPRLKFWSTFLGFSAGSDVSGVRSPSCRCAPRPPRPPPMES